MKFFGSKVPTPNNRLGLNYWRWLRAQPHRADPQLRSPLLRPPGFRSLFGIRKYGAK